jgi:hypothetical protein
MNQREYQARLAELGCLQIGSGLYSKVYSIPNAFDKVIKVGELDEWPSYIQWATNNGHAGKFAPKVYSLKFHDEFYVAIMERLICTMSELKYEHGARTAQARVFNNIFNRGQCEATDIVEYVAELRRNNLSGDLHSGNWMLRQDGQLVITDPVSGGFSSARFRIKAGACL